MMILWTSWWKLHRLAPINTIYQQCLSCDRIRHGSSQVAKKARPKSGRFLEISSKRDNCFASEEVEGRVVESLTQNVVNKKSVLILNEIYNPMLIKRCASEGFERILCTYRSSNLASEARELLGDDMMNITVENLWLYHCSPGLSVKEEEIMKKLVTAKRREIIVFSLYLSGTADWFHMVHRLVHTAGLYTFNTAQWVGMFPARFYWRLLVNRTLKSVTIVNALFDVQHCLTVKGSDFEPRFKGGLYQAGTPGFADSGFADDDVVMLRFTPKQYVMDALPSCRDRAMFKTFIKLIWRRRRLIPEIEDTLPDCGMRMIEEGYGMAEEVTTLSPEKLLHLFQTVTQYPEYKGSAMAKHLGRHLLG